MIVIDTLQKVRTASKDNAYANDYGDISLLKDFADRHALAVVVVYHIRKKGDSESRSPSPWAIPVKGNKRKAQARLDPFFRERCLRLCDIEPQHIRELHESIFKDGCSANTVIHYHAVVRKALQYAVKNELISENAADKVDRPKKGKYLAGFYSKDELAALFEATKDDSTSVVIQLAAYYGLRRDAVDFEKKTSSHKVIEMSVDGKLVPVEEDVLKTKSSFRTLPLIPVIFVTPAPAPC